ncbi:hypothetical protein FQN54_009083 [Arachnomyces sp. PD_36]|nr:hypothetical protein FQN54_009083 [Arachnomyces sp. PD_36]
MAVVANRVQEAFERAKSEFEKELKSPGLLIEIQKTTSIEEVYDAAEKLQQEQSQRDHLRNLRKIEPYLERLRQYADVINTFVQAKAEILALIWGPIRLLLQMSSNLTGPFDAIVNTLADIGNKLPIFKAYTQIFDSNDRIKDVLCLFFKDILDLYLAALNFFSSKHLSLIFESVWPRHKSKIDVVANNIERHGLLMTNEVNLEHIREAHDTRIKALDHYTRTREFQERQDFEAVETHISPRFYDGELDRLLRTVCHGTGRWLQREETFSQWLDHANTSVKLLWLQGIPGAGKTHLSSIIVDKTRQSSRTIFAFLSYKHGGATQSTISILHSLIFQLVTNDKDVQAMLCNAFQSNRRELKSSTKFARETLSTLLKCAGPTYIIVDGLDEIPAFERQGTLCELLGILEDLDETRLLISSRQEDDIARSLKKTAQTIRVDHRNAGCIQAYITSRIQQWFHASDFDAETCAEIKAHLAPLAAKAKGMFLYARIVMDSITTMFSDLDLIRSEIKILPESLEEAYDRILQRLNGCSPVPLTRHEIEQALSITPGRSDQLPKVLTPLKVLELCGPIVEISDDRLYFVHFTVKEYLFDQQASNFVDSMQAHLDVATTCLTYLCSDLFDPEIEKEHLRESILSGGYRLHNFSAFQWMETILRFTKTVHDQAIPDVLIEILELFVSQRENLTYTRSSDTTPEFAELRPFKIKRPKLYDILCRALQFFRLDLGNWRMDEDEDDPWTNLDAFSVSYSTVCIYEQFEQLLCSGSTHSSGCDCDRLKKHYGTRLYGCKYTVCHSQRISFETRSFRDSHSERHGRPYKCTIPTCEFAVMGFRSHNQFQKHWLQCHKDAAPRLNRSIHDPGDDEIQPLLFDLVSMGKVDEVERLMPGFRQLPKIGMDLIRLAAGTGPVAMVQLLTDNFELREGDWAQAVVGSMNGGNIEVLRWVTTRTKLEKWAYGYECDIHVAAMESGDPEVLEFWRENYVGYTKSTRTPPIVDTRVIGSAKSPVSESQLAAVWKELASSENVGKKHFGLALRRVAEVGFSVVLAKALLESGAGVDFRGSAGTSARTPLHIAAKKNNAAAAELTKFFLLSGADPNLSYRVNKNGRGTAGEMRTPSMEPGAQNISKWLGMTWDQLVEWALEQRKEGLTSTRNHSEMLQVTPPD